MRSFFGVGVPPMLRLAAGAQALEAAGCVVAAVAAAVDAASGRSYQASSGIALTVLELIVAVGLAWIAYGIVRVRPWSRTPAAMTQVLCGVIGIIALQGHRLGWGVPATALALVGMAGLFAPTSLRALARPPRSAAPQKPRAAPNQKEPTSGLERPEAAPKKASAGLRKPTAGQKKPAAPPQKPQAVPNREKPAAGPEKPAASTKKSAANPKRPVSRRS